MAGYSGMILTNAGLQLQAQAQLGGELRITKMAVGDGILAAGENYEDLTALKNQKMTLGIQDMEVIGNGQSRIRALITNDNLNTGFFVREVGVFAKIGESGTETLYSYTNASDKADYLPSKGINLVEEVLEVYIIIGNAQNVTCTINDRVTLATKQDLTEHTSNTNNPHNTVASQIANTLITGLGTEDVQSTLEAIFSESKKKSGSIRNAVVTGPVSTSGMANVLRDRYSDNLCVGGIPISGGGTTAGALDNVFDGNRVTTGWESSQKRNACNGLAWVGYTFSVAKAIKKIVLYQNDSGGGVTSVKVQYGADGVTWNDALTTTVLAAADLRIPGTYSAKYWRILANSNGIDNSSVNGWGVREVEMYELLNPVLTDNDVLIQANALVSFAAGFDLINKQPLDYWELTQQMSLTLEAADGYTVPLSYTNDLCNGGTAISSGDKTGLDGNGAKELAFNNNDNNQSGWRSLQVYNAISGVAYIGYNFPIAKRIRKTLLVQPTATENVQSVKLQFSDEGTTWTTVGTYSVTGGENYLVLPDVGAHKYWRFLANSNASTSNWYWVVSEIEMYEALQTHYVYLTRDVNGNVSVGSTRNKPRTVKPVRAASIIAQPGYYTNDICNDGTAISGGDFHNSGAALGYDGILDGTHQWQSAQNAANQNGVSWLGYNFGVPKTIRKIKVIHNTNTNNSMPSVLVQKSADGTTWSDVLTAIGLTTNENIISIPAGYTAQYWRMLAQSSLPSGSTWAILDAEMMEYVESATSSSGVQTDDTTYSDNLCVGGAALSGGDLAGQPKESAFDGNEQTVWTSSQTGAAITNTAYIGYNMGVARHVRKIKISQSTSGGGVSSIKAQRSSDGATWNDVYTATLVNGVNIITLPVSVSSPFWRVLATSARIDGLTGFGWGVNDLTMHELSNDINLYDPYAGISKHYDGSTWDNVVRVFVGEAVTDSAGKVVSYTTYPYNKTKLKALPAEDIDDVVTLGQFSNLMGISGYQKLPGGLILQWGVATMSGTSLDVQFPVKFPATCLLVVPVDAANTASVATLGYDDTLATQTGVRFWSSVTAGVFHYLAIGY